MRFVALLACVIVALDCFQDMDKGGLGLPPWAWAFCGVWWLFAGIRQLVER